MDIKTAKEKFHICSLLTMWGYVPVKENKNEVWYFSPLRPSEKTASFHVNLNKNIFFDFGDGVGGDLIDFVRIYKRFSSIKEVLHFLSSFSINKEAKTKQNYLRPDNSYQSFSSSKIQLISHKTVYHIALKEYLQSRRISLGIARMYLEEIHYKVNSKVFFALGFKNRVGGYELRNQYFKGCLGAKDITFINRQVSNVVFVFEGFFDFLSFLHYSKQKKLPGDVIILNSTSLLAEAKKILHERKYSQINLYLDNDSAGKKSAGEIYKEFPHVINHSSLYINSSDLNEWWHKTM